MLRTLITIFDDDGRKVEALVQAMPRSFKMHVWANYINDPGTTGLDYIGHIQPMDQTDTAELEMLVYKAWKKRKPIDKTEQV